jgi:hypothetical protein
MYSIEHSKQKEKFQSNKYEVKDNEDEYKMHGRQEK